MRGSSIEWEISGIEGARFGQVLDEQEDRWKSVNSYSKVKDNSSGGQELAKRMLAVIRRKRWQISVTALLMAPTKV